MMEDVSHKLEDSIVDEIIANEVDANEMMTSKLAIAKLLSEDRVKAAAASIGMENALSRNASRKDVGKLMKVLPDLVWSNLNQDFPNEIAKAGKYAKIFCDGFISEVVRQSTIS